MAGFGETLLQARTRMGITLKEAEQATRINRHHLGALEDQNFAALPPLIYQRGIVRNYAAYLDLDPGKLLLMFEEAQGTSGKLPTATVAPMPPVNMPIHWAPNFAVIAFALVLSAIVFAWVYSAFVAPSEADLTPTAMVPTATPWESDIPVPTQPATKVPLTEAPTVAPTGAPTQAATTSENTTDSTRGGDNQQNQGVISETQTPEATTPPTATKEPVDTSNMTSIKITATADIYVSVTVDGVVVFDGNLAAGESTDFLSGAHYEVYTSSGGATEFSNNCDSSWVMGYESGEVTYILDRDANSCAAVD